VVDMEYSCEVIMSLEACGDGGENHSYLLGI
jgi:hypothetical protein